MRDPATAVERDRVILFLGDAIRVEENTDQVISNATVFSHVDSDTTLLGLSWTIYEGTDHRDNRYSKPVPHRSAAQPGAAYWIWPEEKTIEGNN